MPWNVPHVAPSNIKITPVDEAKSLKEVMQLALMEARLNRFGGGTGAGGIPGLKGETMMVPDPEHPGQMKPVFVPGATEKERAAQLQRMLYQSALSELNNDKDIQAAIKKIQESDNETARKELSRLRLEKLPAIAQKHGVSPSDLYKGALGSLGSKLDQDFADIQQSAGLRSLGVNLANVASMVGEMVESAGKSPEDKVAIHNEYAKAREERTMQNAYLRDQALRQQTGTSYFGENVVGSDTGSWIGGIGQGIESFGAMATPMAGGSTGAAIGGVVAGAPGALVGGLAGAALGGYPAEQQMFLEELRQRGLSVQEQERAARAGVTAAGLQGAAVNAAVPAAMRGLGRAATAARAGAARVLPQAMAQRVAPATEAEIAGRGFINRYARGLPVTAAEMSAFTAANRALTNANMNSVLGENTPLTQGIGEEILAGAGAIPLFNIPRAVRFRRAEPVRPQTEEKPAAGTEEAPVAEQTESPALSIKADTYLNETNVKNPPAIGSLLRYWQEQFPEYDVAWLVEELRSRGFKDEYINQLEMYRPAPETINVGNELKSLAKFARDPEELEKVVAARNYSEATYGILRSVTRDTAKAFGINKTPYERIQKALEAAQAKRPVEPVNLGETPKVSNEQLDAVNRVLKEDKPDAEQSAAGNTGSGADGTTNPIVGASETGRAAGAVGRDTSVDSKMAAGEQKAARTAPDGSATGASENNPAAQERGAGRGQSQEQRANETSAATPTATGTDTGATADDGRTAPSEPGQGTDTGTGSAERQSVGGAGGATDGASLGAIPQPAATIVRNFVDNNFSKIGNLFGKKATIDSIHAAAHKLLKKEYFKDKLTAAEKKKLDELKAAGLESYPENLEVQMSSIMEDARDNGITLSREEAFDQIFEDQDAVAKKQDLTQSPEC